MYACKYEYMYVCMCACMHIYVCMYVCMHACMHASMQVCMCVCMYVCMYVFMYVFIHACMYDVCKCACESSGNNDNNIITKQQWKITILKTYNYSIEPLAGVSWITMMTITSVMNHDDDHNECHESRWWP